MNFKRWKFNKQVQPELENFLKIVENNGINGEAGELLQQVLPKLPLSHYNLESTKDELQDDIITIDSDNDVDIKREPLSISNNVINLSNTSISSKSENYTNAEQKDLTTYKSTLKECLNDNTFLENEDNIQSIFIDLNKNDLMEVFNDLNENVSDFGLLNLGEILNKNSFRQEVVRQYFKLILLKKLLKNESSVIFMPIVGTFIKNYPDVFRETILLSLLNEYLEHVHVFEQIFQLLPQTEKEILIKEFLFSCHELEEGHLVILQLIVSQLTEFAVKQRLINLMSISADNFKENKIFIKILIEIIKTLNKDFIDLEPALYGIIEKNKTIFKISAEKALNKWVNDCDI